MLHWNVSLFFSTLLVRVCLCCHPISFVFTTLSPSFTRHFHCRIKRFIGRPCCRHNSTLCWSNKINHGSKCTVTHLHPHPLSVLPHKGQPSGENPSPGWENKNFIATWFPSGTLHYTTTELFLLFHTHMHSHALNSGSSYTTFSIFFSNFTTAPPLVITHSAELFVYVVGLFSGLYSFTARGMHVTRRHPESSPCVQEEKTANTGTTECLDERYVFTISESFYPPEDGQQVGKRNDKLICER